MNTLVLSEPASAPHRVPTFRTLVAAFAVCLALTACGGNEESASSPAAAQGGLALAQDSAGASDDSDRGARSNGGAVPQVAAGSDDRSRAQAAPGNLSVSSSPATNVSRPLVTTQLDAVRLANQGSFGPTELLVTQIRRQGAERWIAAQMALNSSRYTSGGSDAVHRHTARDVDFCSGRGEHCWRDFHQSTPLLWDFYRNAVEGPDQLRQRVALALQQFLVVSNLEVSGTYGFRYYYNTLLQEAFGNYREILRKVILSPLMGDYLNNANNDRLAPNENFARELLQLFSLGTCRLNQDGSLTGGSCTPVYDNATVRAYAFALTGWTYPPGGASPWGCSPAGTNCRYYQGDMVPVPARHNTEAVTLLPTVPPLPQGHSAQQALDAVLDSLMAHPNMAPFVSRLLIQHLVTSNPSPAYVARVASAFSSGRYRSFGDGVRGDMRAVVAAILLDAEARTTTPANTAGSLREPIQLFTGTIRALHGRTDGDALSYWWGEDLRQHVFRPPSVFNFYPPDYPVPGTSLVGPSFGIHNANAALQRINFINYLVFYGGSGPNSSVPEAVGTRVNLQPYAGDAHDPAALVDRLSLLLLGEPLPVAARTTVITAVSAFAMPGAGATAQAVLDARINRVRQAAYLVMASPQYQMIR
ncbi:MAG: DUF1800 domain-containing protein [Serpentinimonas sp.]|jgi:uncharacterized protein (DUF1800 family)|nr:DUF1800 domain-containing protein [Serpentinimonas sp.]